MGVPEGSHLSDRPGTPPKRLHPKESQFATRYAPSRAWPPRGEMCATVHGQRRSEGVVSGGAGRSALWAAARHTRRRAPFRRFSQPLPQGRTARGKSSPAWFAWSQGGPCETHRAPMAPQATLGRSGLGHMDVLGRSGASAPQRRRPRLATTRPKFAAANYRPTAVGRGWVTARRSVRRVLLGKVGGLGRGRCSSWVGRSRVRSLGPGFLYTGLGNDYRGRCFSCSMVLSPPADWWLITC